jgi:hypothetical protein
LSDFVSIQRLVDFLRQYCGQTLRILYSETVHLNLCDLESLQAIETTRKLQPRGWAGRRRRGLRHWNSRARCALGRWIKFWGTLGRGDVLALNVGHAQTEHNQQAH